VRYRGLLYRALNPIRAGEALSGEGARRLGGRFNPKGMPALYTSLEPMTAIREANQAGALQPTVLVSYAADLDPVFDSGDAEALTAFGASADMLGDDTWRLRMRTGEAPTQALARRLTAAGYVGVIVRTFARGASPADLNMVLWSWGADLPARLVLNDREGRLSR
jgi:RES domain-containing protein